MGDLLAADAFGEEVQRACGEHVVELLPIGRVHFGEPPSQRSRAHAELPRDVGQSGLDSWRPVPHDLADTAHHGGEALDGRRVASGHDHLRVSLEDRAQTRVGRAKVRLEERGGEDERVLGRPERAAAPELVQLDQLTVEWMTGIQFFLDRQLPIVNGHVTYVDSPWAPTSISQGQFWSVNLAGFGDGSVRDVVSVDVSNWDAPGVLFGKTAKQCTREEIFAETWEEMRRGLAGRVDLDPGMIVEQFLDPGIVFGPAGTPTQNEDPLLVNTVDSWRRRPDAVTSIPNLFLASDYVKTYTDLAAMEGANEAARRAVNGILAASGANAPPCAVWPLREPAIFDPSKATDALRYAVGLPHILSYL